MKRDRTRSDLFKQILIIATEREEDDKGEKSGLKIPEEIVRREEQIAKIQQAKKIIEKRAKERYEYDKEKYDQKMEPRKLKEEKTGKKTPGRVPKEPTDTPDSKDQYNFTDPQSRIMKSDNGFDQSHNA